jgi:hypothetical protein
MTQYEELVRYSRENKGEKKSSGLQRLDDREESWQSQKPKYQQLKLGHILR